MRQFHSFTGQISRLSLNGRNAIVRLDANPKNIGFAVINGETDGRLSLLNDKGELEVGLQVSGEGIMGPEAILALKVERAASEYKTS